MVNKSYRTESRDISKFHFWNRCSMALWNSVSKTFKSSMLFHVTFWFSAHLVCHETDNLHLLNLESLYHYKWLWLIKAEVPRNLNRCVKLQRLFDTLCRVTFCKMINGVQNLLGFMNKGIKSIYLQKRSADFRNPVRWEKFSASF